MRHVKTIDGYALSQIKHRGNVQKLIVLLSLSRFPSKYPANFQQWHEEMFNNVLTEDVTTTTITVIRASRASLQTDSRSILVSQPEPRLEAITLPYDQPFS